MREPSTPRPSKDVGSPRVSGSLSGLEAYKTKSQREDLIIHQRSSIGMEQYSVGRNYASTVGRQVSVRSTFSLMNPEMWNQLTEGAAKGAGVEVASIQIKEEQVDLTLDDHLVPVSVLEDRYRTSLQTGLTSEMAARRLAKGRNVLSPPKETPVIVKFLLQLVDGFNPLLWAAAILCFIAWYPLTYNVSGGIYNLALAVFLVVVILISASFNFWQEWRGSQLMRKFKDMMPSTTRVMRDGTWVHADPADLVQGDVVNVRTGDKVPADIRVIETKGAKVDSAALTGESVPVKLTTTATDENYTETKNLAFLGTSVTEGTLTGLVYRTGDDTMMGKITRMTLDRPTGTTTLHKQVNEFALIIAVIAGIVGLITALFWVGYVRVQHTTFMDFPTMLVNVISVAVAFVPEGLPVCVTCSLSLIASIMSRENVLVKRLGIIDTLGSISTVCSDKTGTLTQNRMTVSHLWVPCAGSNPSDVNDTACVDASIVESFSALGKALWPMVDAATLCTRASFVNTPENMSKPRHIRAVDGDATEQALFTFCERIIGTTVTATPTATEAGFSDGRSAWTAETLRATRPKVGEIPFNSRNKWQASVHAPSSTSISSEGLRGEHFVLVIKGAPEQIMLLCSKSIACREGSDEQCVLYGQGDAWQDAVLKQAQRLGGLGERVLGFAFKELTTTPATIDFSEETILKFMEGMTFLGLASLNDPPRSEVPRAIKTCKEAGIRTVMVTGDFAATAGAIAQKIGIFSGTRPIMTGADILAAGDKLKILPAEQMPAVLVSGADILHLQEEQWRFVIAADELVFARTTPAMKLEIASRIKASGQRVAMTGDGVNDAPALREADVGIAMGINGTDVAKEAASIVLMDDNFSSIVKGVERGRLVFDNLKKIIAYLLPAGSFSEWWALFGNVFLGMPLPLSAFLMIIVCLVTDVAGSLSLVYEQSESDIMKMPPRDVKKSKLVDARLILYAYLQLGVWDTVVQYGMFFYACWDYSDQRVLPHHLLFAWEDWTNEGIYAGTTLDERTALVNYGQSAYFVALVMNQVWNVAAMGRTRRVSVFQQPLNGYILYGICTEVVVVCVLVYVPAFNDLFLTAPLSWKYFAIPLGITAFNAAIQEAFKFARRRDSRVEAVLGW